MPGQRDRKQRRRLHCTVTCQFWKDNWPLCHDWHGVLFTKVCELLRLRKVRLLFSAAYASAGGTTPSVKFLYRALGHPLALRWSPAAGIGHNPPFEMSSKIQFPGYVGRQVSGQQFDPSIDPARPSAATAAAALGPRWPTASLLVADTQRPGRTHLQSSTCNPLTRLNSPTFDVTTTNPRASPVPAIRTS